MSMFHLTDDEKAALEAAARSTGLAVSDLQMEAIVTVAETILTNRLTKQHFEDEGRFRDYLERLGFCPDSGLTLKECARTCCDCSLAED